MEGLNFIVLGSGAWGTAMAIHLAKHKHRVVLVPRDANKAKRMRQVRQNEFHLPSVTFPENLIVDTQVESHLDKNTVVFLACPTQGLMGACQQLNSLRDRINSVISLVKGLEQSTLNTPLQIVRHHLPELAYACLSGPTYAVDFALGKPAAMVLAGEGDWSYLQYAISNESVRVYLNNDVLGVELGGCLKNIYAVGAGILDGLNLGDNARAAYLTRALKEMAAFGVCLGAQRDSFLGLSGLGDLMATAQGVWSRNRNFGYGFAQGQSVSDLLSQKTVEGYWSIACFSKLAQLHHFDAPILNGLYKVLYENYSLSLAVKDLMTRELKKEF